MKLRVVDAESGESIMNASAVYANISYSWGNPNVGLEPPKMADTNGFITINEVRGHDIVAVCAPGYQTASIGYIGDGKVGIHSPYPLPLDPETLSFADAIKRQKISNLNGLIDILLWPGEPTALSEMW